jgi:hypothetical protein
MKFLSKTIRLSLLVLTLAVVTAAQTKPRPRAARPTGPATFEMRCRGGEALVFDKTQGTQLSTGETMMNMSMNFIAGTQPVSRDGKNLQPGQCSWLDRGLRSGEPTRLKLEIVSFAQLARQRHGTPVDTSPTAAERFPDAQNLPIYLRDPNHFWSFIIYNTNEGFFLATSHKYWRPLEFKQRPGSVDIEVQRPIKP